MTVISRLRLFLFKLIKLEIQFSVIPATFHVLDGHTWLVAAQTENMSIIIEHSMDSTVLEYSPDKVGSTSQE